MTKRTDIMTQILSDYAHLSDFDRGVILVQILKRVPDLDLIEIDAEIQSRKNIFKQYSISL